LLRAPGTRSFLPFTFSFFAFAFGRTFGLAIIAGAAFAAKEALSSGGLNLEARCRIAANMQRASCQLLASAAIAIRNAP
jgi:hypothetical protein